MLCRFLKIPGQLSLFHGLVLKMWKKSKIFYEFQDFFTINFFEFFLICSRELLFLLLQCCISAKENVIESRFIACYWNMNACRNFLLYYQCSIKTISSTTLFKQKISNRHKCHGEIYIFRLRTRWIFAFLILLTFLSTFRCLEVSTCTPV